MADVTTLGAQHKIRPEHHGRLAVVYVRQSTMHQVQQHQQSTQLQYSLVGQAERLGWPKERILLIDEDLGISGASAEGRLGFQRLLSEVAFNHVGLILGVEMSRLARSCKDWYQLLELCALFRTLIADLDGLYDPTSYNDRLLLGLKGTMSEAELHILKQRMMQGAMQKAKRGELISKLPIGYVRNAAGDVQFDPDEQARLVVRLVFDQFERLGSASGILRWLVQNQVKLPIREDSGPNKGNLDWRRPNLTTVRNMLGNPMYAGAYAYGRTCQNPTTRRVRSVPRRLKPDDWQVLLKNRFPAYITWEEYEQHLKQLAENRTNKDSRGAPRNGRALLTGLLICNRCGFRMSTRYQGPASLPRYVCETGRAMYGDKRCQGIAARAIDDEVVRLTLLALEPASLEVSLQVTADIERNRAEVNAHWKSRLERARYDAERAHRQYDAVEPENRLVARTLEQSWEEQLRILHQIEEEFRRFQHNQPQSLTAQECENIRQLATDLPRLWNAAQTNDNDRKQILRQVIEQLRLNVEGDSEWAEIQIHWAGGHQTYSRVRRPVARITQLSRWDELKNRLQALKSAGLSSAEIADRLNEEGFRPSRGVRVTAEVVRTWLSRHGLSTRQQPIAVELQADEWTIPQLLENFQIPPGTVYGWIRRNEIRARQIGGAGGRWVVQATPAEIEALKNKRRRCPWTVDPNEAASHSSTAMSVTRGAS